ncbi:hypothetical protein [Microbacterium sp. 22296]|uniref:hypothetical protein n=1 Tax=Microbacterium sp. 22296 TaxID=3453903 RepID=UPI003F831718
MPNSIERIHLTVDGSTFALGPLEGLDDLRAQVLRAARAGGGFLNVTVDGGQRVSFFVTTTTSIVIAVATVPLSADTADGRRLRYTPEVDRDYSDGDIPFDVI